MGTIGGYMGIKRFYMFGKLIFQKCRTAEKKRIFLLASRAVPKPKENQCIFYLKVHRQHTTSYRCIQHWVDIVAQYNGGGVHLLCL